MVKKYILSGSAYSGKTTLIDRLNDMGHPTRPELARLLIEQESAKENGILPGKNFPAFAELIIQEQIKEEENVDPNLPYIFCDRALPDELAYYRYLQEEIPQHYLDSIAQYHFDKVFVCATLPGYKQDEVRTEPLEMVLALGPLHAETYWEIGCDVIPVPVMPVEERVRFLLDHVEL